MQPQVINRQARPIFEEGSCFESISQVLSDIVNKVKEIFMAILRTILPCFFSSAPALDPSRVSDASQITPQVQVPISGQISDAPEPPPVARQPQMHQARVELRPAPPVEQEEQPPAQPLVPPAEQQQQPPAQPVVPLAEEQQQPPAQPLVPPAEQQQPPAQPLFEPPGDDEMPELQVVPQDQGPVGNGAARVQQVLAQIDAIRANRGRPPVKADYKGHVDYKEQVVAVVPKYIVDGTTALPPEHVDAALFVILEAFGRQPGQATGVSLDRMIADGVKKHGEHPDADFDAALAATGLELGTFPVPQQRRYALPQYPTLSRGLRGALQSSYCARIGKAAFSMRMLAQMSGKTEFGILKVGDWVYGLAVVPKGMKSEFFFLDPYSDPISMAQFTNSGEFAQYFTTKIKPENADHNFQYQLTPVQQKAQAAAAVEEEPFVADLADDEAEIEDDDVKEQAIVNVTKLKPTEALAGFYAACIAASSFQARGDFEVVDGLTSDMLVQGLAVGTDSQDPVNDMQLAGAEIVKLEGEFSRAKWVQDLPKLLKGNEPLGLVLTNRNFTYSYGLMVVPSEDGSSTEYRLFCANTDPATFTVHDSPDSLLETLKSSNTRYSAYTIGAYRRPVDDLD